MKTGNFYIGRNQETSGPFTIGQLKTMWSAGSLTKAHQIFEVGKREWRPIDELLPDIAPEAVDAWNPDEDTGISRRRSSRDLPTVSSKSRGIYILLGLLFGGLGAHSFYAGYPKKGLGQAASMLLIWALALAAAGAEVESTTIACVILLLGLGAWILLDVLTVKLDSNGRLMK